MLQEIGENFLEHAVEVNHGAVAADDHAEFIVDAERRSEQRILEFRGKKQVIMPLYLHHHVPARAAQCQRQQKCQREFIGDEHDADEGHHQDGDEKEKQLYDGRGAPPNDKVLNAAGCRV